MHKNIRDNRFFFAGESLTRKTDNSSTAFLAPVVKLVDTQDSGSCASNGVMVRLHSGAPFFTRLSMQ